MLNKKGIVNFLAYITLCIISLFPCYINAHDVEDHKVLSFISDYHKYAIGDKAPDINFTPEYVISSWKVRHLYAPSRNTHWSYMNGTYVLLDERNHRIIDAYDFDIFYKHHE